MASAGFGVTSAAHGAVVIEDLLDRVGGLTGSSPTTDNYLTTDTYVNANGGSFSTDGTKLNALGDSGGGTESLQFVPSANTVYKLSATLSVQNDGSGNWLGIGFGNSPTTSLTPAGRGCC